MALDDLRVLARGPVRRALRTSNRVVGPLLRRGFGCVVPFGPGVVLVETTGRRSGKRRQVPLLAVVTPWMLLVGTARGRSDWLANAEDDPEVAVWLNGEKRSATARVRRGLVDLVALDVR